MNKQQAISRFSLQPTFGFLLTLPVWGQTVTPAEIIQPIQERWEEINYRWPEKEQASAFKHLSEDAQALSIAHPNLAEPLVWEGIVLASEARARGGISALSSAESARNKLEAALEFNERAINSLAHATLGSLYANVPGWPLGFGDDKIAAEHFLRAFELNPHSIDAHFFYAEFLIEQNHSAKARKHLEAALNAPARPNREFADKSRRIEVQALLDKIAN